MVRRKLPEKRSATRQEPEATPEMRAGLIELIQQQVELHHEISQYDPVVAMALIATDPNVRAAASNMNPLLGVQTALRAHAEVARYVHPTVKQVELSGPGGGPVEVKSALARDLASMIKELVAGTKEEGA